jgi:hypothetical protein
MSEDECCGSICGIAIIIGIIWGIWCAISWAVDTFGWMRVVSVPCITMPSSWSCEPTDSVVILSYDSIACA